MKTRSEEVELLLPKALAVIDEALDRKNYGVISKIAPLFSGGHDSYCACFVASQHRRFDGNVYHIDTGTGSKATREFVEKVCKDEGWRLNVFKSKDTYEKFIIKLGFPGPGAHQWCYNWLKDHCVDMITKVGPKHHKTMSITGCRSAESTRRMGHVQPIKFGEISTKGVTTRKHRLWVAPCHDWKSEDQLDLMNAYGMPRNPVKMSPLGMSGECFCGAFARPGELDMIREVCPDVAENIERLQVLAKECGHPANKCVYGGPRNTKKGELEVLETGPMCTSCDNKAEWAGIKVISK